MQEIDYKNNKEIKKAWDEVLISIQGINKDPLRFVYLVQSFILAIHAYHRRLDIELGGDEFGKCIAEYSSCHSINLTLAQASTLKTIIDGCTRYSSHVFVAKKKRHSEIINAGLRHHIPGNELQSWFNSYARYMTLVTDAIKVKIGPEIKFVHELNDQPDFTYPTLLIDSSEDYFIEITLNFIHSLTQYISVDIVQMKEMMVIKELLEKAKELLYERSKSHIERLQTLAFLAACVKEPSVKLNNIIVDFISKIPPGFADFAKQPVNNRKPYLITEFNRHKKLYHCLSRTIPSTIVNHESEKQSKDGISMDEKIGQLPFYNISKIQFLDYSEDYFINATLKLIENLCQYVINHPQANILHDRHHVIYLTLKKANELLFDRAGLPLNRFKELALFAIRHDTQTKGEFHTIVQSFVAKEPVLSEYGKTEITVNKRRQFVANKLVIHQNYYQHHDFIESNLSDRALREKLIQVRRDVMSHLEQNYKSESNSKWKFVNWFISIFPCIYCANKSHKKLVGQENQPENQFGRRFY